MIFNPMKRLFVFGDSFSENWKTNSPYSIWKGYIPKTYSEIISEELGIKSFNFAKAGFSNADIFESVCQNVNSIGENDIVIILWSGLSRFRLVNHRLDKWVSIQPGSFELKQKDNLIPNEISERTINEIFVNRNHILYKKEVQNWINLLKHTFKSNIFINSTWSDYDWGIPKITYERISDETNDKIMDYHWSERGQCDFAQWCISKIKTEKYVGIG
jgi:hypothetical protein